MRLLLAAAIVLVSGAFGCASTPDAARDTASELAPSGTLRIGVVGARARSATFVTIKADGTPRGVPADLGRALARAVGLPIAFRVAPNSGELTQWLASGEVDIAFLPVDAQRRQRVDFGPEYYSYESTYLVRPASPIRSLAEIDRPGMRIVALSDTVTLRVLQRTLKNASITPVRSIDVAVGMLRSGEADALALGRTALPGVAAVVPGSTILEESFLRSSVAIALPKHRPHALAFATRFINEAKQSGEVRRAFEAAGVKPLPPAGGEH